MNMSVAFLSLGSELESRVQGPETLLRTPVLAGTV